MNRITRFGISLPLDTLHEYDKIIKSKGYSNRSRAILDLVRDYIKKETSTKKFHFIIEVYYNHRNIKNISRIENSYPCTIMSSFNYHIDLNNSYKILSLFGEKNKIEKIIAKYKELGSENDILVKKVSTF